MKHYLIEENDSWPEAVSDGLTLPCGVCGVVPVIDYHVSDEAWKVVPNALSLGVVCIECLIQMDPNILPHIERILVCHGGRTMELIPKILYDYRNRQTNKLKKLKEF